MAYPSFTQVLGSNAAGNDDMVLDQDVNGAVHIRSFFSARLQTFTIKHSLSPTQLATLFAFYDANRLNTFSFTWNVDGNTYTVAFSGVPTYTTGDAKVYDVVSILRQTQ